jgi:spore maturation protein CgeB
MRFLKISNYYRGFLSHYYQQNENIALQSYSEQYDHLMGQYFAWSDNYGRLLKEKGWETMEIVANATFLQEAWNIEFNEGRATSNEDILQSQIALFKPDIIYFQDSVTYNGVFIDELRKKHSSIKLCVGNLCAPFSNVQIPGFKAFDFFTVCSPLFQKQLKKYGIKSFIIPHAFDERILSKIEHDNVYPSTSFIFIGSVFADEGFHSLRKDLLEELVEDNIDISIYGNMPDLSRISLLKRQASYTVAHGLAKLGLPKLAEKNALIRKGLAHQAMPKSLNISKKVLKKAHLPVFGMDMFKALSKADIGFNIHIDCAGEYAANMRMFETTGVGTCLVTDYKKNINDFFKDGEEIITYKTKEECVEKVKWLVNHPEECKRIALAGHKRTLSEHNFKNRVNLFYDILQKELSL